MSADCKQGIEVDDLQVGTRMTVTHNHSPADPRRMDPASEFLKGSVLDVVAISLPYLLVRVHDPIRGTAHLSVDVRNHRFMPVTPEYAEAVIQTCKEQACAADDSEVPF